MPPTIFETAHTFAYVFVADWRGGILSLLQFALVAEQVSPGCLTGQTHIAR
jgi:hypothetical protein